MHAEMSGLAGEANGEGIDGEQRGMVLPFEPLALTFEVRPCPLSTQCWPQTVHCSQLLHRKLPVLGAARCEGHPAPRCMYAPTTHIRS